MNPNEQPSEQEEQATPPSQWNYTSGKLIEEGTQPLPEQDATANGTSDEVLATWTASEFVEHEKAGSWYAILAVGAIFLSVIMYVITRQILSVIVVVVMTILFGVYASAKPRTLTYSLMPSGLQIGEKRYPFTTIKSFSIIDEEGLPYIQILFQKRLSIPAVVYAAPDQVNQIADILGQFVPYDQKKRDLADKISSRIRF